MAVLLRSRTRWLAPFLWLAAACSAPQVPPASPAPVAATPEPAVRAVLPKVQWTLTNGDGRVGTYVSKPWGFSTSSYWIEGPGGLVLVDTQFLPSAAEELVVWAERVTGKKAVLAIVLHPNPDKFNGTETLQKRGIRVVTSRQVLDRIPAVHALRSGWFGERYKPDYPEATPAPEAFGAATTVLKAAGLDIGLHVLGVGCSEAHVAVTFDGHLFTGDLVSNNHHAWLEIGQIDAWLQRLGELAALEPDHVHPGRGPSAGPELLDAQAAYLRDVKALVAAERARQPAAQRKPEDEAAVERVRTAMLARYPGHDYPIFLGLGLPAVWQKAHADDTERSRTAPASGKSR